MYMLNIARLLKKMFANEIIDFENFDLRKLLTLE